jgi:hypothetical protein
MQTPLHCVLSAPSSIIRTLSTVKRRAIFDDMDIMHIHRMVHDLDIYRSVHGSLIGRPRG